MVSVIIAKSAAEAKAAMAHVEGEVVVMSPEPVDFAEWIPTILFKEELFDASGTWIPEAHARKTRHVARIQTMALAAALDKSDYGNIAILSADVTPPPRWAKRLEDSLKEKVGMVAGVVPTGFDDGVKAWYLNNRLVTTQDDLGITPLEVSCAALDCCVLSRDAAKTIGSLSGDDLTEKEIGRKLAGASMTVLLNPLVICLHG